MKATRWARGTWLPVAAVLLAGLAPSAGWARPAQGLRLGHIVFERKARKAKGVRGVWYIRANGTGLVKLAEPGEWPTWRADGRKIAFNRKDGTYVMNPDGSGAIRLTGLKSIHWRGTNALVCRNKAGDVYRVRYPDGNQTLIARKKDFQHLAGKKILNPGGVTADGRWLVGHTDRYRGRYKGSNGTFRAHHAAVMLDLRDKSKIYFIGSGCEPTVSPAGGFVYHVRGDGKLHPSVYRIRAGDASRKSYAAEVAYPDKEYGHEYFPRVSTDGKWIAYGATTGCHNHDTCAYQLFLHRLGGGKRSRLQLTRDEKINHRWPHLFVGKLKKP